MYSLEFIVFTVLCFLLNLLNCVHARWLTDPPKLTGYSDVVLHYGESFDISCIGRAKKLKMTISGKTQFTTIMNSTVIKFFTERPEKLSGRRLECIDRDTKLYDFVRFDVSVPEKPVNFRCLSNNLQTLECSWMTLEPQQHVNLSVYLDNYGEDQPCEIKTKRNTYLFTLYTDRGSPLYRNDQETFIFIIKTETIYGPVYEQFVIDHFSTVKLDPPQNLTVLSTTSFGAILEWSIPDKILDLLPYGVEHKIHYNSIGVIKTGINTNHLPSRNTTYQFGVGLPCPNQLYNLNIFIKPRLFRGGIFSDPANIKLNTNVNINKEDAGQDSTCEPKESPEIMLWQIRKLVKVIRKENHQRIDAIRQMKQRAIAINKQKKILANQ